MQRKIHNQTLFVAALSVYLGLLIVGAPPHLLVEQTPTEVVQQDKKFEELLASLTNLDSVFAKEQEEIQKIFFESDIAFFLAYQFEFSGAKIISQRNIVAEGGKRVTAFMRETAKKLYSEPSLTTDNLSIAKILKVFCEQKLDKAEFAFGVTENFKFTEQAKRLAESVKTIFDFAKSGLSKDGFDAAPSNFTIIAFKNDQVTIVTRLPRAGLDALFKSHMRRLERV